MFSLEADKLPLTTARTPFRYLLAVLDTRIQNVDGTAPRSQSTKESGWTGRSFGPLLDGRQVISLWHVIIHKSRMRHGKGPQT